jgi:hypothetical protein
MLSARAAMETFAVLADLEARVNALLSAEDLGGLDAIAQKGIFASRNPEWIADYPDLKATNVQTYIDKFEKRIEGFKGHYDRLSERCHPNSLGHNFMFATLNRDDGTVVFCDERDPENNAATILAALLPLRLVEGITASLHDLIMQVSDLQHRLAPVGGSQS